MAVFAGKSWLAAAIISIIVGFRDACSSVLAGFARTGVSCRRREFCSVTEILMATIPAILLGRVSSFAVILDDAVFVVGAHTSFGDFLSPTFVGCNVRPTRRFVGLAHFKAVS